jgi:hypothetical protein
MTSMDLVKEYEEMMMKFPTYETIFKSSNKLRFLKSKGNASNIG